MPGEGKESESKDSQESIINAVKTFAMNGDFEEMFENFSRDKAALFYDSAESKSDEPEHKLE